MNKKNFLFGLTLSAFAFIANADNSVYTIYPVTQIQESVNGTTSFTSEVKIICESNIDEATKQRAKDVIEAAGMTATFSNAPDNNYTNIYIGVNGSNEIADTKATSLSSKRDVFAKNDKFDKHSINLFNEGEKANVVILGENTNAAFFALATIEQILERGKKNLPCVNIYDYADIQSRGLVEGYYGYPYSISVKKDLMKFMMRCKMNSYVYGAKSDPYHSGFWKEAYPTTITAVQEKNGWLTQEMIKELATEASATKVNFIWAIHPGGNFISSSSVISDIMNKYNMMYKLGVRQFAVFVDDVGLPTGKEELNAQRLIELQNELDDKYNKKGTAAQDTVMPLHFVPHIYAASFAGADARKTYFNALGKSDKKITIYTTGNGVWSIPNTKDLQTIKNDLGRNLGWWWNYPCNDNADSRIYPMDMNSNLSEMPAVGGGKLNANISNCTSIISNPMQEGEVSKIALFSVADYSWNTNGFNNNNSWEASFYAITDSTKAKHLRNLAPYIRQNDPSNLSTLINAFKTSLKIKSPKPAALLSEMKNIKESCQAVEAFANSDKESDRLLANDLQPWLLKLKYMSESIIGYLNTSVETDTCAFWKSYIESVNKSDSIQTEDKFKVYSLEGMGTNPPVASRISTPSNNNIAPFITYLKENIAGNLFTSKTQTKPELITNAENNARGAGYIKDGIEYVATALTPILKKGQYAGISLSAAFVPTAINIADSVYENNNVVYSVNGKQWFPLEKGVIPTTPIKYICAVNTSETDKRFVLNNKVLTVQEPKFDTKVSSAQIPSGSIYDNHAANLMYDGKYDTFCALNKNQTNGDSYIYTLSETNPIYDVRMYIGTTNGDYMNTANVLISEDNIKWTAIPILGTSTTDFSMTDSHVMPYSNDAKYCDFYGNGQKAKYIKFYLKKANTNKWMRINEIEINKRPMIGMYVPVKTDNNEQVSETNDNIAYSKFKANKEGSLTYSFIKAQQLSNVTIYSDKATLSNNTTIIEATNDGTTWEKIGDLNKDINTIDFSKFPNAVAMKISWTTDRPEIYEIVENLNSKKPEVTGIENISANESIKLTKGNNGGLVLSSESQLKQLCIFNLTGKCMTKQALSGTSAIVPFVQSVGTQIIIVETQDGKKTSFKLTTK